jgi:hypothetical protein
MSHPITPPPELVQQWDDEGTEMFRPEYQQHLATRAAQWGADQELEACCELTRDNDGYDAALALRADRRPKPSLLKEQALVALNAIAVGANDMREQRQDLETIRLALEQLS